jgi:lipopolysaccharide export LptBFGC system permease protein LptF
MRPEQMSAIALSRYGAYLSRHGQSREKYDNELWRKTFYPMTIWVMLIFGCIVSFVSPRRHSASAWGLLGVSLGIIFYFVYNVFGSFLLISPEYAYIRGLLPFFLGVGLASGGLTLAARRAF